MTTNNTPSANVMEQAAPVIREVNEALSAEYAAMRKQQISDVAYSLYFNIGHEKKTYNGTSVVEFTMAKGNKSPVTVDFESGTVEPVKVNGQVVPFD
ncbi:hypothetical protein ACMAZF_06125 [Psychrobium sp. nBUS_13]|uniref:hypothetical protein n=1 Tax=Psychrobium sp. nBUS_13 TaxID=3395319 RepID=UPI003EBFF689